MILPLRSLFALCLMNQLVTSQDQTVSECIITLLNQTSNTAKLVRERELIEYRVKYRFGYNGTVTDFKATTVGNSTRFQPWRWYNVNDKAFTELHLMFDNMFPALQQFIDIDYEEIEVFVAPEHCLHESNTEILENYTRIFLLREIHPPNSKTCSAHIENNGGKGSLLFKCCMLSDIDCAHIYENTSLIMIHTVSIVITVCILLFVFVVLIHPKLGIDEFYFYPDNMKILFTNKSRQGSENVLKVCCNKLSQIYAREKKSEVMKTVKRIKLLVNKRKCCNDSYAGISFRRCLRECVSDFNSSFFKPKRTTNCCCEISKNKKPFCIQLIIVFKQNLVPLVSYLAILSIYLLDSKTQKNGDLDFKGLCEAYKNKDLSCPHYTEDYLSDMIRYWHIIFGVFCLLSMFLPYDYFTKFICELKPKTRPFPDGDDKRCNCTSVKCRSCCEAFRIALNILALLACYFTWGIFIFYGAYFVIRVILMCKFTFNKDDNLVLLIFPLSMVVTDKVKHVTRKFAFYTRNIMNLLRRRERVAQHGYQEANDAVAHNPCPKDFLQHLDEEEEFEFSKKGDKNVKEATFIHSVSDPSVDLSFENYYCQLRLKINRPMIFLKHRERHLISRRLVSLMYKYNTYCRLEINSYLKAAALSIFPCFAFGIVFFLILQSGNLYSYSTEVGEYFIIGLILFKWTELRIVGSIKSTSDKDTLPGPQFRADLKYKLENFEESWAISDFEFEDNPNRQINGAPTVDEDSPNRQINGAPAVDEDSPNRQINGAPAVDEDSPNRQINVAPTVDRDNPYPENNEPSFTFILSTGKCKKCCTLPFLDYC